MREGENGEEEKIIRGRKLLEVSSWEEEKKERKERKERKMKKKEEEEEEKRKGTEPALCSGQTRTGSEQNCTTRGRCLPTSVLFYV